MRGSIVTIQMRPRMLTPVLQIDSNLINARQKLDSVNQLEKWKDDGVILINISATAHQEAQHGRIQAEFKKPINRLLQLLHQRRPQTRNTK